MDDSDAARSVAPPPKPTLRVIGWREWVELPGLELPPIKAKMDTGARTSALHAVHITPFSQRGKEYVNFVVHPQQRDHKQAINCRAPLVGRRVVTDSGGKREERYVVRTKLRMGRKTWFIELTLTNRQDMGFRLLLGRTALKGRFLVNPGKSFRLAKRPAAKGMQGEAVEVGDAA